MGFATNDAFLMVGRFVAGISVGYAVMIAPVYTTEISPASSHGFLTSYPEVFINDGILLGYVSNFCVFEASTSLGMAIHARSRSDSLGFLGGGGSRHARVATVARFTRSTQRSQASSGKHLGLKRGG
ncbi:putative polyol transporter 2 [Camellia lanceoleosa]|uniref:Polyol transporter 2 n=1 Tax=Camellia lanceoleosa TaxID=1840588 RepID=A0ACC0HR52_9ERIC|nr:putative polyol transporter 2 [Camellia lanceoleosa]